MSAGRNDFYRGGITQGEVPLFAMAAHELKSPLALIRQLAASIDDDMTSAQRQEVARRIELTSERSLRLTSNLTRSQRLEPTLFPLEPLNTIAVCDQVVRELTPLYEARGRTVRVRQRPKAPLAIGNRDLLSRVLLQFVDNALEHAYSEVVELAISSSRSGKVRIGVRDYGPSVSHPYQQVGGRSITPLRPASSGLGLMISQQFARAMNGQIGVTHHRDGASFYIDLQQSQQLSLI